MGLTLDGLRKRTQEAGRYEVVIDPEWLDEIAAAYTELDRGPDAKRERELRALAEDLEKRRGEAVVVFKLRRLSNEEYEGLITSYPPTAEQRAKEDDDGVPVFQRAAWDKETFVPALVQAAVVSPELSDEDLKELRTGLLSHAEWSRLFTTCMSLTTGAVPVVPPAR